MRRASLAIRECYSIYYNILYRSANFCITWLVAHKQRPGTGVHGAQKYPQNETQNGPFCVPKWITFGVTKLITFGSFLGPKMNHFVDYFLGPTLALRHQLYFRTRSLVALGFSIKYELCQGIHRNK